MMSSGTVARSARYVLARAVERGVGEFLEERVGFAIEDAIALLDHRAADGLGQMTLARAGWAEKERVLALRDEAAGGELVDQRAVHLLVEIEIEGIERAIGIAEARLFVPALEQPVLPAQRARRRRASRRDRWASSCLGLGLAQAGFEDGGHAGQAELAERAIEFDEIHSGSPVLRSMRSR